MTVKVLTPSTENFCDKVKCLLQLGQQPQHVSLKCVTVLSLVSHETGYPNRVFFMVFFSHCGQMEVYYRQLDFLPHCLQF